MKNKTTKNVTLIYTGTSRKEFKFLPGFLYAPCPGIYYIGEHLSNHGFNVDYIDQVLENLTLPEIIDRIKKHDSDIYLFTQFYSTRHKIKEIAAAIDSDSIIGIGGHDASFHAQFLLDGIPEISEQNIAESIGMNNFGGKSEFDKHYCHADFIWRGEAETDFVDYLYSCKKNNSPKLINNLNNRVSDMDSLPILKHNQYEGEIGFLVTSRGCLKHGCDFCTTPQFYPDGWRARSISHVEMELINLKSAGKKFIYIFDDNFFGLTKESLKRGMNILEICKKLEFKCMAMTSVKQILLAESLDYLKQLQGTLVKILLGVENLDTSSLKKLGKKHGNNDHHSSSIQAINALTKNGIYTYLGYINFHPAITLDELKNSVEFLHQNNLLAACFNNIYNQLTIFEGTRFFFKNYHRGGMRYIPETGESVSSYENKQIASIRIVLELMLIKYRELDYLDNEAMKLIHINQLQHTDCGRMCNKLRIKINDFNYHLIMSIIENISSIDTVNFITTILNNLNSSIPVFISEYKSILKILLQLSDFSLNEPLQYLDIDYAFTAE